MYIWPNNKKKKIYVKSYNIFKNMLVHQLTMIVFMNEQSIDFIITS